uniref:BAI1-associated protein 3-like n=1 Tax=Diabrotica virgifera virgifera TaxID=50390 RepID=A0A6P7GIH8_DIAVI
FSDPYCMLGIQPRAAPSSPQPSTSSRTLSDVGCGLSNDNPLSVNQGAGTSVSGNEKLRKHHSFKLSFKRKDGRVREQRDSIGGALPAKFIRATSVKPHTLNPKWNEKFRFDIDDISTDSIHLDIWDHDDESSVLEAVSKLNEVRGVRGLGRFFKQVCQSARQSSQDDFLGCVTIPIQDIPSTGLEGWFRLEARSQRSSVQGRIKLKLWLSTREPRGSNEDDNWTEVTQHENLTVVFINYELKNWGRESWLWGGDLPGLALTILHQHAVQGDLNDLQIAMSRFAAASRVYMKHPLDPRWMLQLMMNIETHWPHYSLNKEEEMWLAERFTSMQGMIYIFNANLLSTNQSMARLAMKAFWKVCPFNKEIRGDIVASLRKGTPEWFRSLKFSVIASDEYDPTFVDFCAELYIQLRQALSHYHPIFEGVMLKIFLDLASGNTGQPATKLKVEVCDMRFYLLKFYKTQMNQRFSDPYCMLGIQPRAAPSSPQPSTSSRTLSDVGCGLSNDNPLSVNQGAGTSVSGNEKLRKHHSFKLSFKRKDGRVREQRDSIGGALPAKFIRATSVKPHTLNPKWNEKFRL